MFTQENAARLHKQMLAEEERQMRTQALNEPEQFVKLAEQKGYHFNLKDLASELSQLSLEAIASILNPGVGPRRHLLRK